MLQASVDRAQGAAGQTHGLTLADSGGTMLAVVLVSTTRLEGGRKFMVRAGIWLWLVAGALVCAGVVMAQEAQSPDAKKPATTESKKHALTEAVRVSTDAAISSAAKQQAQKPASDAARKDSSEEAVTELHPAASEPLTSNSAVVTSNDSRKAKNVHGAVYGSTVAKNPGTRSTGGAVGASSKSGKSSVYVEMESTRTPTPR
jgi:hypothetical protein